MFCCKAGQSCSSAISDGGSFLGNGVAKMSLVTFLCLLPILRPTFETDWWDGGTAESRLVSTAAAPSFKPR